MKKLLVLAIATLSFGATSSALAANWVNDVQSAIKSGDFAKINVIAAKNPDDEGDIAMYLLEQSQNSALNQDMRIKLFGATMPFGNQIAPDDSNEAAKIIMAMLNLANEPAFQKEHHHEASGVITTALSLSDQPNIVTANPNVHEFALALAGDFSGEHPEDKGLQDQVDLALQVGLPPPLGPRGVIVPSAE